MSLSLLNHLSKTCCSLQTVRTTAITLSGSSTFRRSISWGKKWGKKEKEDKNEKKDKLEEKKKEKENKLKNNDEIIAGGNAFNGRGSGAIVIEGDDLDPDELDEIAKIVDFTKKLENKSRASNSRQQGIINNSNIHDFLEGRARDMGFDATGKDGSSPIIGPKKPQVAKPFSLKDHIILPALAVEIPIFPGFDHSISVTDQKVIEKLLEVKSSPDNFVGVFYNKSLPMSAETRITCTIKQMSDICKVGSCAQIRDIFMDSGVANVIITSKCRVSIEEIVDFGPPTMAKVSRVIPPTNDMDDVTQAAYNAELMSYINLLIDQFPMLRAKYNVFMKERESDNALYLADFVNFMNLNDRDTMQRLLESQSYSERFDLASRLLRLELGTINLQKELHSKITSKYKDNERKFLLNEQLRVIQKELGTSDPKTFYMDEVKKSLEKMKEEKVPERVVKTVEEELQKLSYIEIQNVEFGTTRNYIDWLINLPWNHCGPDQMDIKYAQDVLNRDHYGLKDVKDRILEFIAVGKLQGHIPGKVLCFTGPPGTGKTSIARSIATALGREFFQFSVGGSNDVSQIKGHRRTYVGSMPGKLIHCLKTTKVSNPLILIDEVDKIIPSHNGDPASALLEVLDPNQNKEFLDNYIDIPVDFSQALFVCTANDASKIPQALLDRMEVIQVSGYDYQEKLQISRDFLDIKARKATGLEKDRETTPASLKITDDAFECLIRWYCREAGVRSLEKNIEKIYRKVAMKLATMKPEEVKSADFTIEAKDLEQYIGKRIFLSDRLYDQTPPGVVMGLAWTSMGGSTLYIESRTLKPHPLDASLTQLMESKSVIPAVAQEPSVVADDRVTVTKDSKSGNEAEKPKPVGHLNMTGQLGDVMKESVQIAYVNARRWMQRLSYSQALYDGLISSYAAKKAVDSVIPKKDAIFDILETSDLHMHFPEGAVPKDGPSAGCAITTSLLSTALNRPIKQGIAMTGEISLNGKVLPVGGIREKIIAARRAGVNEIILPAENNRDVNELPEYVRENLTVHYATTYEDVLKYTELCPEVFK